MVQEVLIRKHCLRLSGSEFRCLVFAAVASISAGNDDFVGNMIADALDKVGSDGVLSIESSSGFETTVEVEEGMEVSLLYHRRFRTWSFFFENAAAPIFSAY